LLKTETFDNNYAEYMYIGMMSMLKILLSGSAEERKILEEALLRPLNEYKISFNIHNLSDPEKFRRSYLFNDDYNLIVICLDGSTKYIFKGCSGSPFLYIVTGIMSFPPAPEEIDEKLMRNRELASFFSPGEYTVTHHGCTRKIPYEDIDYIQSDNKKTIMHLTNGETETISKNIGKVASEINREYFAKSSPGLIVNTRNIYKIHNSGRDSRIIELKSGAEVQLKGIYFDKFRDAYSLSVSRVASLKVLDE